MPTGQHFSEKVGGTKGAAVVGLVSLGDTDWPTVGLSYCQISC